MQCETLLRALAQRNCLVPIYSCRQRDSLVSVRLVPPPPRLMTTASSAESMSTRCSASVLFPPPSSKTALFTTAPTAAGAECDKRSGLHMAKSVLGTICNRALSTSSLWRGAEPPPPAPSSTLSAPPTASPSASHTAPPTAPSAKDERALQMVGVHFNYGLPQFTVPLPSRNEPCVFTLKPVTHTIGDFLEMLRMEDAGIDRAVVRNTEGVRISSTTSIQTLLQTLSFDLVINDHPFRVIPPAQDEIASAAVAGLGSAEEMQRLGDVRALVGQLYEALNVEEHQAQQEQRLIREIEDLQAELAPLEQRRQQLAELADKRSNNLIWLGLGMMSVQFGVLARLTWWEYSWDIMEPVTYFVTYGTAIACYAYFVLTKQEYLFKEASDRQYLLNFYKRAQKPETVFDVARFNSLREGVYNAERDLKRLRDPLRLRLPQSSKDAAGGSATGGGGLLSSQLNIGNLRNMLKDKFS